ncbi:hypothetical protein FBZ89_102483 [Nitrospirillum amazonense]|uniref:OmpL-like beta-barrel porin-2 n=1 Tax=Nitrospirillum amazonense TaxID=28077 RepID=A0A560FQ26_9PROT|nr:DUF6662 family protein [Nitrospirillum amazonense]TWB23726.1 hypothetical protein FBZ89_102483 [Nitrospirillum amazonense]
MSRKTTRPQSHPRLCGMALACALAGTVLGTAPRATAGEPLFGYIYTTDLLPAGKVEAEQWLTGRLGKAGGDFSLWQGRTEVEYGLTDNLQIAAYANYAWTHARQDGVDGNTAVPETFAEYTPASDTASFHGTKYEGTSVELIWRLLSPYTDPIGLALYVEPLVGPKTRELESRLIVQKNFLDDQLVVAANVTVEQELRRLNGDPDADPLSNDASEHWDHETDVNFGLAASYRFAPNWYAGVEFQNEREFSNFHFWTSGSATNVAYYAGPTIHYGGERFFVNLTYLEQLPFAQDLANPSPGFVKSGRTYADDFEKRRLRLKVGVTF